MIAMELPFLEGIPDMKCQVAFGRRATGLPNSQWPRELQEDNLFQVVTGRSDSLMR